MGSDIAIIRNFYLSVNNEEVFIVHSVFKSYIIKVVLSMYYKAIAICFY
jgi:predicted nuclease of restriction endonuclease-like (RecB) superfamily